MNIRAGELNQLVIVKRLKAQAEDAGGGQLEDVWQEVTRVYAHVRPLTGRERMAADRTESTGGYLVVVRARTDLTEADKLVWYDRELNIRFLPATGPRDLYRAIECELGVAI